jgi:hypothetical protein
VEIQNERPWLEEQIREIECREHEEREEEQREREGLDDEQGNRVHEAHQQRPERHNIVQIYDSEVLVNIYM